MPSEGSKLPIVRSGIEWVVDAHGCDPARLRSTEAPQAVFARLVRDLCLHPLGEVQWQIFPGEGGITGLLMLTESHLAVHTFPERGFAAFNLYCCRPRSAWPWESGLRELIGAGRVVVRQIPRGEP